ncbi:hypothetical protein GA0070616_4502 [Micromonospora nigra]|uniref:Uncharacterized protein n=1 Tax=Micromonospora nigra TaxID=145857 RepID=A0A1C6SSM5_9ACTN|nr:hypothetical protein GA0070616_4502 [Micromonospora nigra]
MTRWAVRLLAGFAVAATCTLGIGVLPSGAAGHPAPVEIRPPVDGPLPALREAAPGGLDSPVVPALPFGVCPSDVCPSDVCPSDVCPADSHDGLTAGPVPPTPAAMRPAGAGAALAGRVDAPPAGAGPPVPGPRAPPVGLTRPRAA